MTARAHPSPDRHDHHHGPSHEGTGRVLAIGIALNLGFVVIEWGFGLYADSLALLADAAHNLGDVLGLVLAWGAARLAQRAPSARFTYGLGASSILAALANAVLLVTITGGLMWEAVLRLQEPRTIQGAVVIGVALAGVAVNGLTAWLLHHGHEHDLNLKGAYLHMLADAAVSVGVAVAGVAIIATGWQWLDPAVTIAVGIAIVWSAVGLLRDALTLALHAVPEGIDTEAVRGYLAALPGVAEVHDLHIWAMSTTGTAMTAHLVMPAGHPGDEMLEDARRTIASRFGIRHVTLQIESCHCGESC